jgi:hypothetical protein
MTRPEARRRLGGWRHFLPLRFYNKRCCSPSSGSSAAVSQPPAAVCRVAEVLSGSLASATVAVTLNPVDIVRTRTQVEGAPALSVLRGLLAAEGVRGLWKGVLPRIAMLVPQGALSVTAYEFVKRVAARDPAAAAAADGRGGALPLA